MRGSIHHLRRCRFHRQVQFSKFKSVRPACFWNCSPVCRYCVFSSTAQPITNVDNKSGLESSTARTWISVQNLLLPLASAKVCVMYQAAPIRITRSCVSLCGLLLGCSLPALGTQSGGEIFLWFGDQHESLGPATLCARERLS